MAQTAGKTNHFISHGMVTQNRKARHDYEIADTVTAGIVLVGSEVKALRLGKASIAEAFATIDSSGVTLHGCTIQRLSTTARVAGHDERRPRRLLLTAREIDRLGAAVARQGMTLVPLALFFNDKGLAKMTLALARGRKTVDKRHAIKDRDWKRQQARVLRAAG